jgi:hypothetical protein
LKQEKVLARWDKWSSRLVSTDTFLEILYADLTEEEEEERDADEDDGNGVIGRTRRAPNEGAAQRSQVPTKQTGAER